MKFIAHLAEDVDALLHGFVLHFGDELPCDAGFQIVGKMPRVCGHEVVVQRDGIGDEFDDAFSWCQREDFVCPDCEMALARFAVGLQEGGDLLEDLLHDGVLAEIVVAAFEELFVFAAVGSESRQDFGHADSRGDGEFGLKFGD